MTQENNKKTWSANAEKSGPESSHPLGAYLQRERQKKQQTIEEVAHSTCIPTQTLKALEAGDKNLLPLSVYTKGFVKIYALHLGLDEEEILERFSKEWGTVSLSTPEVLSGESLAESSPFFLSFRFYFILLLLALALGLAYFFFQADDPQPVDVTALPPAGQEGVSQPACAEKENKALPTLAGDTSRETPLISPQSAGKLGLEHDLRPEAPQGREDLAVDHDRAATPMMVRQDKAPADAVEQEQGLFLAADSVHLHIRFLKRTHLSVSQDDKQPAEFIFTKGEESSWQATNKITLHVDPADAVEMTLNGSPVTIEGTSNDGPLAITLPTDLPS
jgi:cytoskeletal protein RodZ